MEWILIDQEHIGLFTAFLAAGVEFVVVGGVAVNAHGYSRATRDVDIFIRPSVSNAEAAFRALQACDVPLEGMDPTDLLMDDGVFRFAFPEDHVDILNTIGEMSFEDAWSDRVEIECAGLQIPFISKQSLLRNKRQVGRFRDLDDVENLERIPDV